MAELSRAEMIAEMTAGQQVPQQAAAPAPVPDPASAPAAAAPATTASGATPPRAQMIAEMTGQPAPAPTSGVLGTAADHPWVKGAVDLLPAAGSLGGGIAGAAGGSVVPGAGTIAGEVTGAAGGGAAGSLAKDALNSWLFGEKKSAGDVATSAATEGALGGVSQGIGSAIGAGASAVAATRVGKFAIDAAGDALAKGGELLTMGKVPAEVIKRYVTAGDEIAKMSAAADGNVAAASDSVKQGYIQSLQDYRATWNKQLSAALKTSDKTIESQPIVDALEKAKAEINPTISTNQPQIQSIKTMIDDIAKNTQDGKIPVSAAHDLKESFQSLTQYGAQNGAIGKAAQAAKDAARLTRQAVNAEVPEIATANNQLELLHKIQDKMTRSILAPQASEAGLVAAGKGANDRNLLVLQKLSKLTGQDFVSPAQNLGAMSAMGNASLKQAGAGALVGGGLGYEVDGQKGAVVGATLGGALTSPYALKKAIDVGRGVVNSIPQGFSNQTLGQAVMHGTGATQQLRTAGEAQ